jgi:colicin import membrane protein
MSKDLALQQTEWDLHENPTNFIPLEFTEEIKPDLFGLELAKAQEMTSGLSVTLAEREVLKNTYINVIELEITTETLPTFKELRLKIVKNRTQGIEKWHKENKAFYLAGGRFVDAIKNKEIVVNEEMEAKLMDAEKFFENQEKEKARLLNESRIERLKPFVEDITGLDFAPMSDEDFDDYLLGKKTRFENDKKEREAELLKIEQEKLAEIERQKAIEVENAKLKAEAEAKQLQLSKRNELLRPYIRYIRDYDKVLNLDEKAFQKELSDLNKEAIETVKFEAEEENKKQQLILDAENEKNARLKVEKELKEKQEAEAKETARKNAEILAQQKEAEKLSKAPIKTQMNAWIDSFEVSMEIPNELLQHATTKEIVLKFNAFKYWAKGEIDKM